MTDRPAAGATFVGIEPHRRIDLLGAPASADHLHQQQLNLGTHHLHPQQHSLFGAHSHGDSNNNCGSAEDIGGVRSPSAFEASTMPGHVLTSSANIGVASTSTSSLAIGASAAAVSGALVAGNASPTSMSVTSGGSPSSTGSNSTSSTSLYPSISAAYWQPAPNPTPYLLPERKLFVGMLNKKFTEQDVRQMFGTQGAIEECTVLRDQSGQSKGCAFVTYANKQSATGAIKALHQSQTMDGCSAPLVVKFADTQREKEQKKIQQMHSSILSIAAVAGIGGNGAAIPAVGGGAATVAAVANSNGASSLLGTSAGCVPANGLLTAGGQTSPGAGVASTGASIGLAAQSTPLITNPPPQANPFIGADASASMQLLQQLQSVGMQHPHLMQGYGSNQSAAQNAQTALGLHHHHQHQLAPITVQNLLTMAAISQQQHQQHQQQHQQQQQHQASQTLSHHHQLTAAAAAAAAAAASSQALSSAQLTNAAASSLWSMPDSLSSAFGSASALANPYASNMYATGGHHHLSAASLTATAASIVAGKQVEGPDNSNLFIYHLPQEFTDTDLASTFIPFGNVLSAKVFIDKQTNLSKCFGFVSYDNAHSAQAAIQAMHGFQIGSKRLKVQLKRSKDAAKPY